MSEEIKTRANPICVVGKEASENGWRDVQSSTGWHGNPYGDAYAIARDELVPGILATGGYLDPVFSEDGTEVVDFTPLEKPDIQRETELPSQLDMIEAQVTYTAMMTDTLLEG